MISGSCGSVVRNHWSFVCQFVYWCQHEILYLTFDFAVLHLKLFWSPLHIFFVPVGTTVQLSLRFGGFSSFFSKWSRFDGFPWVAVDTKFLAWPDAIAGANVENHHRWPHWHLHWLSLHFIQITSSSLNTECRVASQHRDRNVTRDCCNVTSPYAFSVWFHRWCEEYTVHNY